MVLAIGGHVCTVSGIDGCAQSCVDEDITTVLATWKKSQHQINRNSVRRRARGISLLRKSVRDSPRTKGFLRIFDGFFLQTKGFLPKAYEIFLE